MPDDRPTYASPHDEVDADRFDFAFTLPRVTMRQFVNVRLQVKRVPPKATWFVPRIRSRLATALPRG